MVHIEIPPEILPALRRAMIEPSATYRVDLPGGRSVAASGAEWAAIAGDLIHLAGAMRWGGEPTVRRALRRLQGVPRAVPPRITRPTRRRWRGGAIRGSFDRPDD